MRISELTMFMLVILLTISVGLNVFLYAGSKAEPVVEIVQVSDTVIRIDTIFKEVTQRVVIEKPIPVYVDTANNVRTYRDTIFHQYGTIRGEQIVYGELLKKDLKIDFKIPEVYKTLEVTNTVTRSVRNRMLFATIGLRTDFNHNSTPVFGLAYFPSGHRYSFGVDYAFDRQISAKVGFAIIK